MDASLAATDCDVFFTIGTSAVVYPAAGLVDHAHRSGALTVEINPDSTPASGTVDVALGAPAEQALPELDRQLAPHPLILNTPRLLMHPVLPRDTAALHQVWTDPQVRRFLWDDAVIPVATAAAVTSASANDFAAHRYGLWSLSIRGDAPTLAGFCGLRTAGIGPHPELLFGLLPAFWGQGLAIEAAREVLSYAFGYTPHPENHRGDRCAQRAIRADLAALGMYFDRRAEPIIRVSTRSSTASIATSPPADSRLSAFLPSAFCLCLLPSPSPLSIHALGHTPCVRLRPVTGPKLQRNCSGSCAR